jgi:predicted HTH transcriptional regulator
MRRSENWADFSIAKMILGVVTENEEITLKELSNRLRTVNSGHRIYTNAINKAISLFLTEVLIPVGKDTWKIKSHEES